MNVFAIFIAVQVSCCTPVDMQTTLDVGAKGCALFSGSASDKWDVVFVGDGFTESCADTQLFHEAVGDAIETIEATSPFDLCAFNFYWVRLNSKESGADHPFLPMEDPNRCKDTPLNSQFGNPDSGNLITVAQYADRILYTPTPLRCFIAANFVAPTENSTFSWDLVVVIVNDRAYGGRAQPDLSPPLVMVSRSYALDQIVPHELAHIVGLLGDEYDIGGVNCPGPESTDELEDPEEPNLTTRTDRTNLKWPVASEVPIPTILEDLAGIQNFQNMTEDDRETIVGLWEGANLCQFGFYRPQYHCMMRSNNQPLCTVCSGEIQHKMVSSCAKITTVETPFDFDFRPLCIPGVEIRFPLPPCPKCLLADDRTSLARIAFPEDDKMMLRVGPLPPDSQLRIVDQWNDAVETMHAAPSGGTDGHGGMVMFQAAWPIEFNKHYFVEFIPMKCPLPIHGDFSVELRVNEQRVSWPPESDG